MVVVPDVPISRSGSACRGIQNQIALVLVLSGSIVMGQHFSAQVSEISFWLVTTRNSN